MPELIGSAVSPFAGVTKEYAVASGVTVTSGDFVYLTSGRVTSASIAGKTILGIVHGGQSNDPSNVTDANPQTATGNAGGTVKVLVHVEPNAKFVVTSDEDSANLAASDLGKAFDLIGSTGAQLLDVSSGSTTTGQVEVVQVGYKGDTTKAIVIINEHKYKVNA